MTFEDWRFSEFYPTTTFSFCSLTSTFRKTQGTQNFIVYSQRCLDALLWTLSLHLNLLIAKMFWSVTFYFRSASSLLVYRFYWPVEFLGEPFFLDLLFCWFIVLWHFYVFTSGRVPWKFQCSRATVRIDWVHICSVWGIKNDGSFKVLILKYPSDRTVVGNIIMHDMAGLSTERHNFCIYQHLTLICFYCTTQ